MASRPVEFSVQMEINRLNEGDTIEISNRGLLEIHTVVKVKRVNISTTFNGAGFNVPFSLYKRTVEKFDINKKRDEEANQSSIIVRSLKPNELFWIKNSRGDALLFKFIELKNGRVVGLGYGNNHKTNIDISLVGGKVI